MRRPVVIPDLLARICIVTVGISLGGAVTPDTVYRMAAWPASLAALAVAMVAVTVSVAFYLRYVHGWDALSALFAAAPGALSQSLALAADTDADIRSVAMVQAVRILVLTVGLPLGFAIFGVTGVAPVRGAPVSIASPSSLAELAGLVVAGAALAVAMAVAGGLAVAAATLLSLRIADVVIAYAPGGLEAMTILAFALHLDPVFVGVHQIARFVVISLLVPLAVLHLNRARRGSRQPSADAAPPARAPEE